MTHAILLLGLIASPTFGAQSNQTDLIFNLKEILAPPLAAKILKRTEKNGIVTEEIKFHSETDGEKRVDIFAYFSYPKNGKKLPAFIWNQGGLSKATTYWTEFGAKRGYATLCIDFPLPGYRSTGGYPITSGLELGDDPRKAPIYHGAVALLRAVSYLQTRPEVDRKRIGMAGSSWGGFYTTLMAGLDPRLKAAACMFGCGGLHLGNLWWDGRGWDAKRTKQFRQHWQESLDPALRLKQSKTPIAWFTGTNDQFYWLPALMHSYRTAAGPKHLSLLPNWNHALNVPLDEQVFAWLDQHLKGAKRFVQVSPLNIVKEQKRAYAEWTFSGTREITSAELIFSYGATGNWQSRYWLRRPAQISDGKCRVALPGGKTPYFASGTVIDKDGFRYSTALQLVRPAKLGLSAIMQSYNGCSLWGDFESEQITICQRHGWPTPSLGADAKFGKQCGVLKSGIWRSPPLLGTCDMPHQLDFWMRADRSTTVGVAIHGQADGKKIVVDGNFKATAKWRHFTLDFRPPQALSSRWHVAITVPKGLSASVDGFGFRAKQ